MGKRTIKQKVNYTKCARLTKEDARGQGRCDSFYGWVEAGQCLPERMWLLGLLRAKGQNKVIKDPVSSWSVIRG